MQTPDLLIYDYAPDVRQVGNYLYFCASRKGRNCPILRTADPLTEPFTEVSAPFAFWNRICSAMTMAGCTSTGAVPILPPSTAWSWTRTP